MYVVVRSNLPAVHQLIQSVHAAHEAGIRFGNSKDTSSVVVCSVPDETSLRLAAVNCSRQGIRNYLFLEDDFGNQATAFATEPITGEARRTFRKFPLWNPEFAEAVQ